MVKDSESGEIKNTKDVLLQLLYYKLELKMDIEGTKRHFYEQSSLRTFVSFYLMLKNMKLRSLQLSLSEMIPLNELQLRTSI